MGGGGVGSQQVWPVLLLLVAAVVVPTACVLWFMSHAIRNERLAVRDELNRVYRGHLAGIKNQLLAEWSRRIGELDKINPAVPAAEAFAGPISKGLCDSVILRDRAGGIRYPFEKAPLTPATAPSDDRWDRAGQLEYREGNAKAAAGQYAAIAAETDDANGSALALQAQARCLASTGDKDAALEILAKITAEPRYLHAVDPTGRLIVPAALLQALRLMKDRANPRFEQSLKALLADGTALLLLPDKRDKDRYERTLRYVFTPDGVSVDAQMVAAGFAEAWRSGSPPREAYVVSPFFDSDGKDAMNGLLQVLAKRRPRRICIDVRAETGLDGRTRVFAPHPMMQLAATQAELAVRRVLWRYRLHCLPNQ